ncbi:6319_t:CDS:1 [Funneliformis caledonium]|uniref:6319_t:CDS:1 n=1 Tax=Funneliformis caledonium TaxID=1117310 RepID=A0A9N9ISY3_9GLOM|nr:6319_t:CDS:1 [Funneliformis caledonium]
MNLIFADKVGIPSFTLAFLYHMKFLNEGDIVKYRKVEAMLHKNSSLTCKNPCYLVYKDDEYDSIQQFVGPSEGRNYKKHLVFNEISYNDFKNKVGKFYRLMQIINEAINN